MKLKVLAIDDDKEHQKLLASFLEQFDMDVTRRYDGTDIGSVVLRTHPDIILLDINLPGHDGYDVLMEIRKSFDTPVIMLTARGDATDRILGLEMGADDYIAKPFNARELVARVKSVMRRYQAEQNRQGAKNNTLIFNNITLDKTRQTISANGAEEELTALEYKILVTLVERPNTVIQRDHLMDVIHGREAGPFDRCIDIGVCRLRKKLYKISQDPNLIKTCRGDGYQYLA